MNLSVAKNLERPRKLLAHALVVVVNIVVASLVAPCSVFQVTAPSYAKGQPTNDSASAAPRRDLKGESGSRSNSDSRRNDTERRASNARVFGNARHRDWPAEWDQRWQNNWGNSWSGTDNDGVVVVHKLVNQNFIEDTKQNATENWASISKPGMAIPNFHEVHPWLFRGGQPTPEGLKQLYGMGVRTVVDLRTDPEQIRSERELCEENGLRFITIPVVKTHPPAERDVRSFNDVIEASRQHPDSGAVFVHCHHGGDRTGCMIALYRMSFDSYTPTRAYSEMLRYGFNEKFTKLAAAVKRN